MYEQQEIHNLKTRVTHLENQVKALMEKSGMSYSEPSGDEMNQEVHELAMQGKKKSAIRLYMKLTGATLKEAKRAVEAVE